MKVSDFLKVGTIAIYTVLMMLGFIKVLEMNCDSCKPKPQVLEAVESQADSTTDGEEVEKGLRLIPLNLNE